MYLAELHGKLSSRLEGMEDILTSNVFSFFKYCNRAVFFKQYLEMLGFQISVDDVNEAEFIFWPRFEENTEPDLVVRVGGNYILFEAKYFSDFDDGNQKRKAQLVREIEGGMLEARNNDENFFLVAITADYCYKPHKFSSIPSEYVSFLKWTNWHKVATLLQQILEGDSLLRDREREFAWDLYSLLCKKNLREFIGVRFFDTLRYEPKKLDFVFFDAKTASFRGDFIGFRSCLSYETGLAVSPDSVFFSRKLFKSLTKIDSLTITKPSVFFKGQRNG